MKPSYFIGLIFIFLLSNLSLAQVEDDGFTPIRQELISKPSPFKAFGVPTLIALPGLTYGIIALHQNEIRNWDFKAREGVLKNSFLNSPHIEDYTQYLPGAALLSLYLFKVKSENRLLESATTFAMNSLLLLGITQGMKYGIKVQRPDYSAYNSFPSGHTATAFALAEWLRIEFSGVSPWIGVAGYAVASSVGVMRVMHNRHWVSDVVMGASIGFLCTNLSFKLKPYIIDPLFQKSKKKRTTL